MKHLYFSLSIFLTCLLSGCQNQEIKQEALSMQKTTDYHTYAQPNKVVMTHLNWDASLDFETKTIQAVATATIKNFGFDSVSFDTKDLDIQSIVLLPENDTASFEIGENDPVLGAELKVNINPGTKKVAITYKTSATAEAVQWLSAEQTLDKTHPFLFTQSQAILARSWIPVQDSPGIRFTYTAKVQVPSDLMALMSATNPTKKNDSGIYTFEMAQPIPAYLLALTVGNVEFKSLGKRSGVYAEPGMLKRAAYELEDTEEMIAAAEALYGPYQWEQYDIVVLPPSFPFGGMENPRLTFATPTIIAGDKSLTSLVAHELAHSWSGNLVTNETWDDFWLNEGFTVYFEYRIMESVYGRDYSEMLASLSRNDVEEEVNSLIADGLEKDTELKLNLKGRNPDDGMTSIAYDKGYFLLRWIEEQVGREKWDTFLKNYFTENAFKTMNTERFMDYIKQNLLSKEGVSITENQLKNWIYSPGIPTDCPSPSPILFEQVDSIAALYTENNIVDIDAMKKWSTHEWLHFVRSLPEEISTEKLKQLDQSFQLTEKANAELFTVWAKLCIQNNYSAVYAQLSNFLEVTGRRKFVQPLFQAMLDNEDTHTLAVDIYKKSRGNYHFVTTNTIDAMMAEAGLL